jgi:hypothetical protein
VQSARGRRLSIRPSLDPSIEAEAMQGTDEVNPRAVLTSSFADCYRAVNCQHRETLPLRHHHVNLGLRLAQGQGASNADASRMPECPNLNALLRIRSGYQSEPPGCCSGSRSLPITRSVTRCFTCGPSSFRLGFRDARTLRDRLRAIQKPSHNDPEVQYCIDGQDWWRPVESPYINMTK